MILTITRVLLILGLLFPWRTALSALLSEDNERYALCGPDPALPPRPQFDLKGYGPDTLEIEADQAETVQENLTTLRGRVEAVWNAKAMRTDLLTYDRQKKIVDAHGNVQFWDDKGFLSAQHGRWDIGNNTAQLEAGGYQLFKGRGRGKAATAKIDGKENLSYFEDVDYTTCDGEVPAWKLAAKHLKLDHDEEWGQANHAILRVKDIPVFYWPYLTFPLSDKRKSGFLPPTYGHTKKLGAVVSLPYYWNIAPQADATLTPRYLSERGEMLRGEFRYLLHTGRGRFDIDYVPSDHALNNQKRYLFGFNHQQGFFQGRGNVFITYAKASDVQYLQDFGTALSLTSRAFLEQRGDLFYAGDFWNVLTRVQAYQSQDSTLTGANLPYKRLPQVLVNAFVPGKFHGLTAELQSEAVNFERASSIVGNRIALRPVLSFPIRTAGSFLIPRLSLDYTHYSLDNTGTAPNDTGTAPNDISRTLPIASVDSGLIFERQFELGKSSYLHTLEPRLFYLYIPFTDQNNIPIFDTTRYDTSYFQLFRENRFSGRDRIGDANQVTAALISRFINRYTGMEHLRVSVGQIFSFTDQRVTMPGQPPNTNLLSETVAELTAQLSRAWSLRGYLIWDPNKAMAQKETLGIRYWPDPYRVVNAEYRFRRDVPNSLGQLENIDQTDISFRWPLTQRLGVVGGWGYSLVTKKTLEAIGGVEYNSCCWSLKAVARHFLSNPAAQANQVGGYDTVFFVELELKGLANFGSRATSFLKTHIPGYQDVL